MAREEPSLSHLTAIAVVRPALATATHLQLPSVRRAPGFLHVFPFLAVAPARAQAVTEEFLLPNRAGKLHFATESLARPLFPRLDESRQHFGIQLC